MNEKYLKALNEGTPKEKAIIAITQYIDIDPEEDRIITDEEVEALSDSFTKVEDASRYRDYLFYYNAFIDSEKLLAVGYFCARAAFDKLMYLLKIINERQSVANYINKHFGGSLPNEKIEGMKVEGGYLNTNLDEIGSGLIETLIEAGDSCEHAFSAVGGMIAGIEQFANDNDCWEVLPITTIEILEEIKEKREKEISLTIGKDMYFACSLKLENLKNNEDRKTRMLQELEDNYERERYKRIEG